MTYLIYGGNGWIGGKIVNLLESKGKTVIKSSVRLDDTQNVSKELDDVKPSKVICCIGRTHGVYNDVEIPTIDYLEKPGKLVENIRDNLFAPFMLAMECQKRNIHMTYMGTGCIFSYTETEKIFTEDSLPNFFGSSYSVVKGYTDRMMHSLSGVLNIRIRMPISSDKSPRNLLIKLLKYNKICSIPNSMTILDELLPVMIQMSEEGKTGTVNLVNPGVVEHKEILELYKKYINPEHTYEEVSYEEQRKLLLSDRSNNELDSSTVMTYEGVSNIKEGIEKIMKEWCNN